MKYLIKIILHFCKDTVLFMYFLFRLVHKKSLFNPIKTKYNGISVVLANGPSLKDVLPYLTVDPTFKNVDFIVMNFFAYDDIFFKIKPKHYCLADPIFIQDSHLKEKVVKLYKIFQEKIDWNINIYVPKSYCKRLQKYSKITNKCIHYIPLNSIEYCGYESLRFFFYKKGLSMPQAQTVANMAIFAGLNSGYSEIILYGVDHSYFDFYVNEKNQLFFKMEHFYDNPKWEPQMLEDGSFLKIADHLESVTNAMKSHTLIANYAKFLDVRILNCTKNSFIDVYERKKFNE